jgi:EAL domain-containing protein (putative c-di-GMP-specific phosphodiesterase class I)
MVQQLGCTCIQGFYFGRPLAVADARALALRSGQATTSAVA